jgi:ABC-type glycerol-3-phosphate transport system permease component
MKRFIHQGHEEHEGRKDISSFPCLRMLRALRDSRVLCGYSSSSVQRRQSSILLTALLAAAALAVVFPLIWLVCASLKTGEDLFQYSTLPWGHLDHLTGANYIHLFTTRPVGRWMISSIFLASAQTLAATVLASLGGFAVAKYRFTGRRLIMGVFLSVMLLPYQVLLPSSYELMHHLGWLDSYRAILAPGAVSVFGLFLFSRAMQSVPDDLLHAGRIDGCSEIRLWWEIAIPLVRPMIAAFTLLSFTASWNAFLWPQIVLQDEGKYTLPIGLANMSVLPGSQADYGLLMAGTLLSIVPVVIVFFTLQRDFVAGLTSGAVKE